MDSGLITRIFEWGTSVNYDRTTASTWLAGLVLVLIVAFLWSTVIRMVE